LDAKIKQRFVEKDIDITAPMWGAGELMTTDDPKALESKIANENSEIAIGLPRFGLKQERRKIRLNISNPSIEILHESNSISADTPSSVKIKFFLPSGCYATTVLRELIQYTDCTQRAVTQVK
jgi:tRNA pseudouridine13 synthase